MWVAGATGLDRLAELDLGDLGDLAGLVDLVDLVDLDVVVLGISGDSTWNGCRQDRRDLADPLYIVWLFFFDNQQVQLWLKIPNRPFRPANSAAGCLR